MDIISQYIQIYKCYEVQLKPMLCELYINYNEFVD